jgi:hypothetical protein
MITDSGDRLARSCSTKYFLYQSPSISTCASAMFFSYRNTNPFLFLAYTNAKQRASCGWLNQQRILPEELALTVLFFHFFFGTFHPVLTPHSSVCRLFLKFLIRKRYLCCQDTMPSLPFIMACSFSSHKQSCVPPSSGRFVGEYLTDYMAQHPRRQPSSYSLLWEPEISPRIIMFVINLCLWLNGIECVSGKGSQVIEVVNTCL